ncbi:tRNA pseudouridine(38-40) synthase TruA [Konateibacter massiliensis]|uniref:tRNA pseudouridine(38-40) synthase TruA n=1 Tax=Konateibacter massiliensis TaxID=2002841 RepID=UPI000C152774|nr:tRNA pseudouridine(38-40) synthase TruA [Konateibacter massiliensis]
MKNYLLIIQYDGSAYHGWQKQKNTANTIQEVLEHTIGNLLGEKIELHGSGRTDSGVHALGQAANFKCKAFLPSDFLQNLNEGLPPDIKVTSLSEVPIEFHSRFSAVAKQYEYYICCEDRPSVFRRKYVYHIEKKPDMEAMRQAARLFTGMHDFRSFSSEKNPEKGCSRTIYEITVTEERGEIVLSFYGNGFLYNMVRILSGVLLKVGTGELKLEEIEAALHTGEREFAKGILPACGLVLKQVFYENGNWK